MYEDLKWFGFEWSEGPDCGGTFAPYQQSERTHFYRAALEQLRADGFIYPCTCSRKDIASAARAPHAEDDDEPMYPGTCRNKGDARQPPNGMQPTEDFPSPAARHPSLRFRVPAGELVSFTDGELGPQRFIAGKDFGDFVVWRPDDVPAYQLACVVDDAAMKVTEVVRGADLLKSTARQLLIYRALNLVPPQFYHCPLLRDDAGQRLAKRHDALSLRVLRLRGESPKTLRRDWA
jgi:glutamyl-tRNA synthetase